MIFRKQKTNVACDVSRMTRVQKLAALLVILGPDSATKILNGLSQPEVQLVATEMGRLPTLGEDIKTAILGEFSALAVQASTEIAAPASPAPAPRPPSAIERLNALGGNQIVRALEREQPSTISVLLSVLPPQKASEVMLHLDTDRRDKVL